MTTVPSEEAPATSTSMRGDGSSAESPTPGSRSQASVRADVPAASSTAVTAERQDVVQVSIRPTTSEAVSLSGDKDEHEDASGFSREPELTHLAPGPQQMPVSLQNQVRDDGPVQDARLTQSLRVFQPGSPVHEETPQTAGVPGGEQDLALSPPSAVVRSPQNVPVVSIADADTQLDTPATGTAEAVEEPESPEASHPDSEASPSAESQAAPESDVAEELQAPPSPRGSVPPSPGGSVPPLPGPSVPLDSGLYVASGEDNYLHSMTSLLAGGEGSIRSLADVLVWSEDTLGVATGLLASGRGSVTDLLRSAGPRLRSASSILRTARLAVSWGLTAGTNLAMLCVTCMLERAEQRTVEGIRSAVRYLTGHLTPR